MNFKVFFNTLLIHTLTVGLVKIQNTRAACAKTFNKTFLLLTVIVRDPGN